MPTYGKVKVNTITYDSSGSAIDLAVSNIAVKADPTFTGTITAAALTLSGNLQVNGTTTTVASSTMTVADKNIELAKGAANDAAADGGGITLESGDGNKEIKWVDATNNWTFNQGIETTGAIKGNSIITSTGNLGVGTHSVTSPNSVNRFIHVHNADHSSIVLSDDQNTWEVVSNNDLTVRDGTDTRVTVNTLGDVAVSGSISTSGGSVSDSKGDVRTIVQTIKSAQHTIVAADSGKHSINSTGGWIINTSTGFTAGQAITLINNSGSDQTVTNTGCTMYLAGDTSTKSSLTLKGRGVATFICTASNVYYGSGAGLE
tara:strand:+ start:442 stop:1392 length:951 start_codon:yes stop_codon:yes gene_type:complete